MGIYLETACMPVWTKTQDWWDLFLAHQEDLRDPIDEMWRSNVFVPLPFTATRAKVAAGTDMIANMEPIWQIEATQENTAWADQAKSGERLLDYVHRMNVFRKFLSKLLTSRSVMGTTFFKVIWKKRASTVMLYPDDDALRVFVKAIQDVQSRLGGMPAPDFQREPDQFEEWRNTVNLAARAPNSPVSGLFVPAPPVTGPTESVEYEGPMFQQLPLYRVLVDPYIDEMRDQPFVIHRMIVPQSYVTSRADNKAPVAGGLPYIQASVEAALGGGWSGELLTTMEQDLAQRLGLDGQRGNNPYLNRAVLLEEVWSPMEPFKFTVVLNNRQIINKAPFEQPLLTTTPNIFALRNISVPGFFFGLSDYHQSETLFAELNSFRRIRRDGATLNTLPVFVKQAGISLTEQFKKLKPGLVLTLPSKDAITSLIQHTLPPEAYREPAEMRDDIYDATEVPPYMKGAQATLNRVTGVEFQGRSQATSLKNKIDVCLIEDELLMLPVTILAFFAQMKGSLSKQLGGDPTATVDLEKSTLVQMLGARFRFRGASKHLQEDLQVQQLTTALQQFQDVLTPAERRAALQIILEILDLRGWSKVVTPEGAAQVNGAAAAAAGAANAQNGQAADAAQAAGVQAPGAAQPAPAAPGAPTGGAA